MDRRNRENVSTIGKLVGRHAVCSLFTSVQKFCFGTERPVTEKVWVETTEKSGGVRAKEFVTRTQSVMHIWEVPQNRKFLTCA